MLVCTRPPQQTQACRLGFHEGVTASREIAVGGTVLAAFVQEEDEAEKAVKASKAAKKARKKAAKAQTQPTGQPALPKESQHLPRGITESEPPSLSPLSIVSRSSSDQLLPSYQQAAIQLPVADSDCIASASAYDRQHPSHGRQRPNHEHCCRCRFCWQLCQPHLCPGGHNGHREYQRRQQCSSSSQTAVRAGWECRVGIVPHHQGTIIHCSSLYTVYPVKEQHW